MTYAIFDIETTTRTSFKRKANPFDPHNWVVAVGHQKYGQPVKGVYFSDQPMSAAVNPHWFVELLEGINTLVGFNIKFDILHAIRHPAAYAAWKAFIARGGTIWDCQLAEYLLDGMHQSSHMLPLDEVAPRYGGDVKDDEVKALWDAGVDTPNIPKDLLMRYLCGASDHLGDIDNTRIVFLGQAKRAKEAKQVPSIMLNMGSLVYTIEAEFRGMYVDKQLGLAMAEELLAELNTKYEELQTHLPPDLPFEFNLNSRFHMSAWLFGGSVKYEAPAYTWDDHATVFMDEYDAAKHPPIRYAQKDETHYLLTDGSTCSQATVHDHMVACCAAGKPVGIDTFKSGKNAGQTKTKKVKVPDLTKPKTRLEDRYYEFPGITTPDPKWKSNDGLTYSTAAEVIDILVKRDQPFLKVFGEYTSLKKDLGTYFITTDDKGVQKGMLTLVDEQGLVHHKLNHTSTVTGRFSSSDPNLQNLPKGDKSRVKELFKSRFPHNGCIIQSDFTALEVYVQAVLTGCKNLIDDLLAGIDMHCMRLAIKEKMSYEEVYDLCRVQKIPEWERKRTEAKVFSFQRAYGAGAPKIAESTGMDIEEVKALIAAEEERYPEIAAYYEELAEVIAATAKDVGDWGTHPDFPKASINLRRGYYRTPDNKLYSYKEAPAPKFVVERQGVFTSFTPTEVKNYVVQGTGAEWAKAAMWIAVRLWYMLDNFNDQSFLINQVHDALYADSAEAVAVESAAALHACMNASNLVIQKLFGYTLPVTVPSDTKLGPTMADEANPADEEHFKARVKYYEDFINKHIKL